MKNKGSATLIVIITSIIFMLYAQSAYADVRHTKNMYNDYENQILSTYKEEYDNKLKQINIYEEGY